MKKIITIGLLFISVCVCAQNWQYYDSLCTVYLENQNYDSALVSAEKALDIVINEYGNRDTLVTYILATLTDINKSMSNYPDAIKYCEREREIRRSVYGEDSPAYARNLNILGSLYQDIANYEIAESLYYEALRIRKEVLGEKNADYAVSLNNLGNLYQETGNYDAALKYSIKARIIRKEVLGERHPDYALSLNNLGFLYLTTSDYSSAENMFLEATRIRKEVLGNKHPDYANSINNLAYLYTLMGNYDDAEILYKEARNIWKTTLGETNSTYSQVISNLAYLYYRKGDYTATEPFLIEAKNIRKGVLGEKHPEYATSLNNLAGLYRAMKEYQKAEPLQIEAMNIYKEALGEKHPLYALSLNNLAYLHYLMGNSTSDETEKGENYSKAEALYIKAKDIRKEILGDKHSDYARTLNDLANTYRATSNYTAAESLYLECLDIINTSIFQNFAFLSEKEKELYFNTRQAPFTSFYSFSLKYKTTDPGIIKMVFNNVVKNKGLLLKSSTAMRTAIINSNDTTLISNYEKWIYLKKEISKLYSVEITKRGKNPEELEQEANKIEKELVRGSRAFSDFDNVQNLSWEKVKNSLKPDEAAIEFVRFPDGEEITYCALIVTPQSIQPEMIRLFSENEFYTVTGVSELNNLKYITQVYGTNVKTNEDLYRMVWQPLEPYLKNVKKIFYSPDGVLHKLSFAALGKGKNIYLCDNYYLQQVGSTGFIAINNSLVWDEKLTASLFGGIEYSTDTSSGKIWNYLPGTKTETDKVATIFKEYKIISNYFSGISATEDTIKSLASNCNILHISTHGFFYPNPDELQNGKQNDIKETKITFRGGNNGFGLWQFVKNKNPLMRSGLAMAGANNVWSQRFAGKGEDGVLTALEVTQLDLSNTQLVVLSACETGLGDIRGSEGVYGLQRAFKMAGVKYIIMSLWQVPDKETVEFMETFYKKLLKEKDVRSAFNETQKEMRKKYDPYYWGAFVLIE